MIELFHICQLLLSLSVTLAKNDNLEVALPLCPRHIQYLPQDLPMHCRMPRNTDYLASLSQSGAHRDMPQPEQEMPEQSPVMPDFMQGMPQHMPSPGPMPGQIPGLMPLPPLMPMPGQGAPPPKLPVIVMPFYSPDPHLNSKSPHHKKHEHDKKKHFYDSSEDSNESGSSSDNSENDRRKKRKRRKEKAKKYGIYRRFNRRNFGMSKKKPGLLTPILQYVTKDGFVVYEKELSKSKVNDWLEPKEQEEVRVRQPLVTGNTPVLEEQNHQILEDNISGEFTAYAKPKEPK